MVDDVDESHPQAGHDESYSLEVSASPPSDAASCSRGLVFTSPVLAWAMLNGIKLFENRPMEIAPGWLWVYVTAQENSKWTKLAHEIDPKLPSEEELLQSRWEHSPNLEPGLGT